MPALLILAACASPPSATARKDVLLLDVRVRRAIAYAIDKATIVQRFTAGAADVATEDLSSFMWASDPHVRSYRSIRHAPAALTRRRLATPRSGHSSVLQL